MAVPLATSAITAAIQAAAPVMLQEASVQRTDLFSLIAAKGIRPASDRNGPVQYLITTAATGNGKFTPGGDRDAPGAFANQKLQTNWGAYQYQVRFSDQQLKQIAESGNQRNIFNQVEEQLAHARREWLKAINTDMISGTDTTNGILGLTASWIHDTNTIGGLARGTYTALACYNRDGGGDALTAIDMDNAYNTLVYDYGGSANVILCGYAARDFLCTLSTGALTTQVLGTGGLGGEATKHIGYTGVQYQGLPVVVIANYTATRLDMINLDAVHIEQLAPPGMAEGATGPEVDGDTLTWSVFWYPQLVLTNPKFNATFVDNVTT